jgi:hypothetical protein
MTSPIAGRTVPRSNRIQIAVLGSLGIPATASTSQKSGKLTNASPGAFVA